MWFRSSLTDTISSWNPENNRQYAILDEKMSSKNVVSLTFFFAANPHRFVKCCIYTNFGPNYSVRHILVRGVGSLPRLKPANFWRTLANLQWIFRGNSTTGPRAEHGALEPLTTELGPSRVTSTRDGRRWRGGLPSIGRLLARAGGGGEADGRVARDSCHGRVKDGRRRDAWAAGRRPTGAGSSYTVDGGLALVREVVKRKMTRGWPVALLMF
jgi:hypothetical protein